MSIIRSKTSTRRSVLFSALGTGFLSLFLAACPVDTIPQNSDNNTASNNTSSNNQVVACGENDSCPSGKKCVSGVCRADTNQTNSRTNNQNNTQPMMHPPLGDPKSDPSCEDKDGDGYYASCASGKDCHDGNADVNPGKMETCENRLDDDCSNGADNDCACKKEGDERACYPGPAGTAGKGSCRIGKQTCLNGVWSTCIGYTLPLGELCNGEDDNCDGQIDEGVSNACGGCGEVVGMELCGDGVDNDCDGQTDEGCFCDTGNTSCYSGTAATRMVGACSDGMRICEGEFWGECTGSITPVAEVCGDNVDNDCDGEVDERCGNCAETAEVCDGVDNNCDGVIDEDCTPCIDIVANGTGTAWEMHRGGPPVCFGKTFANHGDPQEYEEFSKIPAADDPNWEPETDNRISFDERSTLCGAENQPDLCPCKAGGDFTYFQTTFDVPPSLKVDSLAIEIKSVDDGARITIFNSMHPNGIVDAGSYAYFPGGSTTDLGKYIVAGKNRVVITHVDDCCKDRRIADVIIKLNDKEVTLCE